jgi:steroid 5-alpha reductase family enzyme
MSDEWAGALASFAAAFGVMLLVMLGSWFIQKRTRNAGWVDVCWTFGAGAVCVAAALWPIDGALWPRQLLVAPFVAVWSVRLGAYIAPRVAAEAREDARYARMRAEWGDAFDRNILGFILIQAPAAAILALSVYAAAHSGAAELGWRDALAGALLVFGLIGEAVADDQMRRFRARPDRAPIMDQGLWGWSRHPNYFFEWLVWTAYPVLAFDPARLLTWLTLAAPALMYLILRYGSGVPILEKSMLESRGEAFRRYQARVSAFFPLPPRRTSQ